MTFVKGHSGFKKKGTKHKETLLKEERRAVFEARISQKWEEIIDQLRPEYIADQYLGKAPDKVEFKGELTTNDPALEEAAKAYATASIKRKLSGGTSEA